MGHTIGEYAEKRQVGKYQLWSVNYNRLLNRADVRMDDLASPWRIECYSDGSMKCVVGASREELEYIRDPVTFTRNQNFFMSYPKKFFLQNLHFGPI
jgi:hypothetical protein